MKSLKKCVFYQLLSHVDKQIIETRVKGLKESDVVISGQSKGEKGLIKYLESKIPELESVIVRDSYLWSPNPSDIDIYVAVDTSEELYHEKVDTGKDTVVVGANREFDMDVWKVAKMKINDLQRGWLYRRGVTLFGDDSLLDGPTEKRIKRLALVRAAIKLGKQAKGFREGDCRKAFHRMILAYLYLYKLNNQEKALLKAQFLVKLVYSAYENKRLIEYSAVEKELDQLMQEFERSFEPEESAIVEIASSFAYNWKKLRDYQDCDISELIDSVTKKHQEQNIDNIIKLISCELTIFPISSERLKSLSKIFERARQHFHES